MIIREKSATGLSSAQGGGKMKRTGLCLLLALVVISILPGAFSWAAPYYEGKRITIIVGFGPGGGYDRLARIMGKHLPKYIPGNPAVIVENMEGAGSMICANHIYNIAKPDGMTLGTFNRGLTFAQLTGVEGRKFDLLKFTWIGSAAVEATVLTIRSDLPYKTYADLEKSGKEIVLGSTGPGDSGGQFPMILQAYTGLKVKMITYPSSADVMLAVERKELDGRGGTYSSLKPFIDRGVVRPVVRGSVSEAGIENLPVDQDLTSDKMGKTLMAMLSAADRMGRPYVAPPGTPPEVMAILKEAFAKVAKDPEAQADAKKNKMDIEYVPADEVMKTLQFVMSQPPDVVKEFSKYVKF
jgi:tripartite-type tricarboxylate transporter receptor subunit TctC